MSSAKSTARDMTSGPILKQLVAFALPLMLGNVFQMLYNTVDSGTSSASRPWPPSAPPP